MTTPPPTINFLEVAAKEAAVQMREEGKIPMGGSGSTGMGCPLCHAKSPEAALIPLINRPGKGIVCRDNDAHVWNDSESLFALKPPPMPVVARPQPPQPGMKEIKLQLHESVLEGLAARFKDRMNTTIVGVLRTLCHPGAFLWPAEETARIGQAISRQMNSPTEIAGTLIGLFHENNELKAERAAQQLRQKGQTQKTHAVSAADFGVELTPEQLEKVKQAAARFEISHEAALTLVINQGLLNL